MRANDCSLKLLGYNYYLIISVRNLIRNQSESLTQWEVEISLLTHFVTERWIYPYQGQSSPSYCQGYTDLEFARGAKSTDWLETRQFSGVVRSKQQAAVNQLLGYNCYSNISIISNINEKPIKITCSISSWNFSPDLLLLLGRLPGRWLWFLVLQRRESSSTHMFARPSGDYRARTLTAERAMHSWSITTTWDYHRLQLMYYDDMSTTGLSVEVFSCCYPFSCLCRAGLPDREQTSNISLVIISGWSSFFFSSSFNKRERNIIPLELVAEALSSMMFDWLLLAYYRKKAWCQELTESWMSQH